jgi:hypothetical protein
VAELAFGFRGFSGFFLNDAFFQFKAAQDEIWHMIAQSDHAVIVTAATIPVASIIAALCRTIVAPFGLPICVALRIAIRIAIG